MSGSRHNYRTLRTSVSPREAALAPALIGILARGIHDLPGIVAALNQTELKAPDGGAWSEPAFIEQMETLGAYPNSAGASLGSHQAGVVPPGNASLEGSGRELS